MLTDDRRAEIAQVANDRAYLHGSHDHECLAIRDLLAEADRLAKELAECHELLRVAERGDTIRPGSVTLLLRRHGRPT